MWPNAYSMYGLTDSYKGPGVCESVTKYGVDVHYGTPALLMK